MLNPTNRVEVIDHEEPEEGDDTLPETFDFSSPEDVLICVIKSPRPWKSRGHWRKFSIDHLEIISGEKDKNGNVIVGAARYEHGYAGFLDYTLEQLIDCPKHGGYYVVEGVTGVYHRGDWAWGEDDDMEFNYTRVRKATKKEIRQYGYKNPS